MHFKLNHNTMYHRVRYTRNKFNVTTKKNVSETLDSEKL